MRLPDPIANTTTEAYLAYKAGVLEEGDLKPKLYEPYIHLDAWLAYWTGLTKEYPVKGVGKNLFNKDSQAELKSNIYIGASKIQGSNGTEIAFIKCKPNTTYTISKLAGARFVCATTEVVPANGVDVYDRVSEWAGTSITVSTGNSAKYLVAWYYNSAYDTATKQEMLDSLQFEEGSTATAYEPYSGEPEMLTDEEAYIAYLSGATDTYPEEFRDPADIRVAAYLRYLISARFSRPEYPVTNEEFYLSLMKTKYIPSGDPSTDIEIDGTAKAPFGDVKMYGDTFQQTYTGKNLIAIRRTAETKNGVTCTWDGASFTLNGTTTANTDFYGRGWWGGTSDPIALPAGTYTMSLRKRDGSLATDAGFSIDCYYGTTWVIGIYRGNYGAGFSTVTFDSDTQYSVLYISLQSGKTYNNEKFYVQLEKSESPTAYEPFVGGQPSPNPDYPQPIQTVTGLQTVEIVGKNLFDDSVAPASDALTTAGVSWSREDDGSIHTSGTNSGAYRFIRYEITLPAGSYWFGGCPSGGSTDGYSMVIQTDYSDPSTIKFDTGSGNTFTLAQQTTIQVFPIRIGSQTVNMDGKVFKPIIVAGSMASDYIPYSEQMYQLDLGDIELNNLDDTYVDYIWKDGEEWKVHKEVGQYTFTDASGFTWGADRNRLYISPTTLAGLGINFVPPASQTSEFYALSDKFKAEVFSTGYADSYTGACFICSSGMTWSFRGGWSNGTEAMSAFADTTVYYALATPTDTTITDTALIAQLEALVAGGAENGTTYIKVSATDPNLPGLLYVEAPKYE